MMSDVLNPINEQINKLKEHNGKFNYNNKEFADVLLNIKSDVIDILEKQLENK